MKRNASLVVGATFALPLLTVGTVQQALAGGSAVGDLPAAAMQLTDGELDTVTAGALSALPLLPRQFPICEPIGQPPIVTTLAIGEEGGYYPYPIVLEPIKDPVLITTMAMGEEGGGFDVTM
jgi:hypothetical protein